MSRSKPKRQAEPDLLDELIAEETERDSNFPALVEAELQRRVFARQLAEKRQRLGLSQTEVAHRMRSTQRIVSRLENGGDVQLSTLARYVEALGLTLQMRAGKRPSKAA